MVFSRDGPIRFPIGPRLEVAHAWASGRAFDVTTIMRAGSGIAVLAGANGVASTSLGGSWRAFVELELGAPLRSFDARADRDALGLDGFFAGASIGASLSL